MKTATIAGIRLFIGAGGRNRTGDLRITNATKSMTYSTLQQSTAIESGL
jgi:hypothetical protein